MSIIRDAGDERQTPVDRVIDAVKGHDQLVEPPRDAQAQALVVGSTRSLASRA
jgi:hypothetical protein